MFKLRLSKNPTGETAYPEGEHAPDTLPASCLGERCPNFKGSNCQNSYYEWEGADATEGKGVRDHSKPPLLNEAIYVSYGQVCLQNGKPTNVRYRIDDYQNEPFNLTDTGLIVHGDSRFGQGIDVEVHKIQLEDNGPRTDTLVHVYDGWG